ncbi:MAG: hypothetical protein GTN36_00285 [Candidatus Aenigmarchaeota archaeon]|nr:hypothetical protein [Candidatus Aenigmarchaeota archaeon]
MDIRNLVVAFFIVVIVLILVGIAPSESETGYFILPSATLEIAILLILFSLFVIASIVFSRNKSFYPF